MATDQTKLLQDAGESLYGALWQSELARALGVADRTVRRWVAGDTAIPPGVWREIRDLLAKRAKAAEKLVARLERAGLLPND